MTHIEDHTQELAALMQMRDEDIDLSDIPEVTDWSRAEVGKFYRPIKESVTLRVDADVLVWLKSRGPGYQTRVNQLLRAAMSGSLQRRTVAGPDQQGPVAESELCFPSLEKQGELAKYDRIAKVIEMRHSVFAPVA